MLPAVLKTEKRLQTEETNFPKLPMVGLSTLVSHVSEIPDRSGTELPAKRRGGSRTTIIPRLLGHVGAPAGSNFQGFDARRLRLLSTRSASFSMDNERKCIRCSPISQAPTRSLAFELLDGRASIQRNPGKVTAISGCKFSSIPAVSWQIPVATPGACAGPGRCADLVRDECWYDLLPAVATGLL